MAEESKKSKAPSLTLQTDALEAEPDESNQDAELAALEAQVVAEAGEKQITASPTLPPGKAADVN